MPMLAVRHNLLRQLIDVLGKLMQAYRVFDLVAGTLGFDY